MGWMLLRGGVLCTVDAERHPSGTRPTPAVTTEMSAPKVRWGQNLPELRTAALHTTPGLTLSPWWVKSGKLTALGLRTLRGQGAPVKGPCRLRARGRSAGCGDAQASRVLGALPGLRFTRAPPPGLGGAAGTGQRHVLPSHGTRVHLRRSPLTITSFPPFPRLLATVSPQSWPCSHDSTAFIRGPAVRGVAQETGGHLDFRLVSWAECQVF